MGKQINFYMDSEIEAEFISMVLETYIILTCNGKDGKIQECHCAEELNQNINKCYLYKQEYGNIHTKDDKEKNIDIFKSPVIEFIPSKIIKEKKIVLRGRLWMDIKSTVFFSQEMQIKIVKDYEKLVRWIKKNVPYQKYFNVKGYYEIYINDSLKQLGEEGYHFMA